jgi:hypothetical protein
MTFENTKDNRRKILSMLAEGTISVEEADRLLSASTSSASETSCDQTPKFLRLLLEPKTESDRRRKIDIRMPLGLLRSAIQIAKSLPGARNVPMTIALGTHTVALDLNGVDPQNVDEFVSQFKDLTTDIDRKDETLRLFCE